VTALDDPGLDSRWRSEISFPLHDVHTGTGTHPALYSVSTRVLSRGSERGDCTWPLSII